MGRIVTISCTNCGVGRALKTGCGALSANLEEAFRVFPEEVKKEVLERIGGEMFPVFDFSFQIAFCSHCADFVSVPVLKLPEYSLEYIGVCEVCNNQAERIEHVDKMLCPVCHQGILKTTESGFWD